MSYNSKYTGAEVEALLDKVNEGNIFEIKYTSVTSSTGSVELSDTKMYILG